MAVRRRNCFKRLRTRDALLFANPVFERQEYAVADRYELIEPEMPIIRRYIIVGEVLVRPGAGSVKAANIPTKRHCSPIESQGAPLVREEAQAQPESTSNRRA